MRGYPTLKLTKYEYGILPRDNQIPEGFLNMCELGYRFRYPINGQPLEDKIVGEVVDLNSVISNQTENKVIGSGRGINYYKVEIVEKK